MKPIGMPSLNKISLNKPPLDKGPTDKDALDTGVFGKSQSALLANQIMRDASATDSIHDRSPSFVLVANPNRPWGGLWAQMAGGKEFFTIPSKPNYADYLNSGVGGPPSMSSILANLNARIEWNLPLLPGNDTITISPEAQAAADVLDPVE